MVKAYAFQRVEIMLGRSEVLTYLRVAGRMCKADVLPDGVQLLDDYSEPLCYPVTHREAGIVYLGMPDTADHYECEGIVAHFDGSWSCYAHGIFHAKETE